MNTIQDTGVAMFNTVAGGTKSGAQETQDRFLSLLIAQMKNQDPLNPLDNAQLTSQMAQLSTVHGIEKMNASLKELAASLASNQLSQAAGLIGRGVLAPGDRVSAEGYQNIIGFELSRPADRVVVTIYDASGRVVRTLDLGARDSGVSMLAWDGLRSDGSPAGTDRYRFRVEAMQGGRPVNTTTLSVGLVDSVSQGSHGVQLNLAGNASVGYAEIRQIF